MKLIQKLVLSILVISMALSCAAFGASAASDTQGTVSTISSGSGYSDISGGWFEKWAAEYGYPAVFSNGDGCFYPGQSITRMEFARMLHKALDIGMYYFAPTDIGEYFDDVTSSDAGAGALYDLVTCGIIDTKGSFRPTEPLDRDEMIHFIMNAFSHFTGSDYAFPALALQPFGDDADIKAEYRGDVGRAAVLGVINGVGSNLIHPRREATRAEAVTVAGRLAGLLKTYNTSVVVKASASENDGALVMTLTILNNTENTVTIDYSSAQQFDFQILDKDGAELYRWSDGRMFSAVLTTTELAPGKEAVFTAELDAGTYSAIKNNISTIKAYITGTSPDFAVSAGGYLVSSIQK